MNKQAATHTTLTYHFSFKERLHILFTGASPPQLTKMLKTLDAAHTECQLQLAQKTEESQEWFETWEKEAESHYATQKEYEAHAASEATEATLQNLQHTLEVTQTALRESQRTAASAVSAGDAVTAENALLSAENTRLKTQLADAERKLKKSQKHTRHLKSKRGQTR